jgi:CheY-like chemotaxis protein
MKKIPNIVIFDNNETNVSVILNALEEVGDYFCQHISSLSKMHEVLNKQIRPDLILCNATMKGIDTRTLCSDDMHDIPCVFISVLKKSEERRSCYLGEQNCYITTPLLPGMIKNNVASLLCI